jgi:FkbM family methyltransferase
MSTGPLKRPGNRCVDAVASTTDAVEPTSTPTLSTPVRGSEFISYAQNAEDVVLWRALRHVAAGTYVDVGAADPVADSVTCAFYERGWRGVNVEPDPSLAAALTQARPEDQTFTVAAGHEAGRSMLYVSDQVGRSTLLADVAGSLAADDVGVRKHEVEVRTLDEMLAEAGLVGSDIHFCKIDVEGAEPEVLGGFDLATWRPWVLVIESTRPQTTLPAEASWEPGVVQAGYSFCLFDGLNRFYVADEHGELIDKLSYPACVFDRPYERAAVAAEHRRLLAATAESHAARHESQSAYAQLRDETISLRYQLTSRQAEIDAGRALLAATSRDAVSWRSQVLARVEELALLKRHAHVLRLDREAFATQAANLEANLDAMQKTVSWRLTSPLRAVRRARLTSRPKLDDGRSASHSPEAEEALGLSNAAGHFAERLKQASALLLDDPEPPDVTDLGLALDVFEMALQKSDQPSLVKSWLALVATVAAYPNDIETQRGARLLRTEGPIGLIADMRQRFERALESGKSLDRRLHIVRNGTLVDVTHTLSYDLHTGIQRVVRETVSRWIDEHETVLVCFDLDEGFGAEVAVSEVTRMGRWKEHLPASGSNSTKRVPPLRSGNVLVPWSSTLLLPELVADRARCDAYRGLATSGILSGLGVISFDLIPLTATETVAEGMSGAFAAYMSVVKHATRASAISETTARDLRAFNDMLASQGLAGPRVATNPLPAEAPPRRHADIEAIRRRIGLGDLPLVLVVGSHEPRKNHMIVLEAAHRLWRSGAQFHLLMIGGSGWRSDDFDEFVQVLMAAGHPLTVWRRASEAELWAAYHLAAFTVFPSLVEGYGLPVVESLRCGTPAITSDYGSLAEISPGGGVVAVDPRSLDHVEEAMRRLLVDDGELALLRGEAAARTWGDWDEYAAAVWDHLTAS